MKWLMDIITSIAGAVKEFFGWRRAKEENRVNPVVVRREDKAEREQAAGAARAEIAAGDTAAMARTADAALEGETGAHDKPTAAAQEPARAEIAAGDTAAMGKRLKGLLCVAAALTLTGCAALRPVPPPPLTWEPRITADADGSRWIAVPEPVYTRMIERLIRLKQLEEQGRVRDE